MTDIVERLRSLNADFLHEEAADEIERLRTEVNQLSTSCGHCGDLERAWAEAERLGATLRRALHLHDMEQAERPAPNVPAWVEDARALLTEGER